MNGNSQCVDPEHALLVYQTGSDVVYANTGPVAPWRLNGDDAQTEPGLRSNPLNVQCV